MQYRDETEERDGRRISMRVDGLNGPGGDFVVNVERQRDRFLCVVGDVTGHGPQVAGYRIELATRLEELARTGAGPAQLLNTVNAEISDRWPADMFACLVCIDVDVRRRHARIAVAGHLPPILKTLSTASVLPVIGGPPVGLLGDERYTERELWLERDTLIIVATDGIGDALMTDADPLGIDALEESVRRAPRDSARLCDFLFETAAKVGFRDDASVVALDLTDRTPRRWNRKRVFGDRDAGMMHPTCVALGADRAEHTRITRAADVRERLRSACAIDDRFGSWWQRVCEVRLGDRAPDASASGRSSARLEIA